MLKGEVHVLGRVMVFQSASHMGHSSNGGTPVHQKMQKTLQAFLLAVVAFTEGSAWQMAKEVFGDYATPSTLMWR